MKAVRTWLAASLVLTLVLSGCTSGNNSPGDSSGSTASGTVSNGEAGKTGKLTLVWNIEQDLAASSLPADASKDFVKKAIEEKFNVDLKIESAVTGAERENKLTIQLAGGDAPDLFVPGAGGGSKYAVDGVVADMTPFINEQTMPNYFKWVKPLELERYAIEKKFVRAPIPFARQQYWSWYIRKDWLDKLNLQVPKSYNEYVNVLRAFTNNDPDGNGIKDTYGFSTSGNGKSMSFDFPEWIKNGLYASFVENNKYIDGQTDLRVANVVEDILKLSKEGLIDPDWFLNKGQAYIDKAVQGKVGVVNAGLRDFAFDSNPSGIQARTKAIIPTAEWVPFTMFPDQGIRTETLPGAAIMFAKSVAEEKPENIKRSVEILNWLCGEEGYLLTHFGIEGKHYNRSGNEITIIPEAYDADIASAGNFLDIYDFFGPREPKVLGLTLNDPRMTDRDTEIEKTIIAYKYHPSIGTNIVPPPGIDLSSMRTKMSEYHSKMLFDEKSAANWPKYRDEILNKYDGQKIFDAYEQQIKAAGVIK